MIKTILLILMLATPALTYAGEQVVLLKKDCYKVGNAVTCKGVIKNIGDTDVKDIIINVSSKNIAKNDYIDYLPAKESIEFTVNFRALNPWLAWEIVHQIEETGLSVDIFHHPVN